MRAAVYHGPRDIRIEEVPRPDPSPGELVLRVHGNGICGTDAAEFTVPQMYPLHYEHPLTHHHGPMVPGHEFAGHVARIGDDVEGFTEGELAVTGAALWCGECGQCRAGRTSICAKYGTIGLHRDGALAEYVRVPAHIVVRAEPFGLQPDAAVLTQPMAIAVHAVRRGRPRANENVLVIGAGGIGAFLTYALAQSGAAVVAVDVAPERLEIARRLGAVETIAVSERRALAAELARLGFIPTLVYEVTGTDAGLVSAIAAADPGGRIVTVGIAKHPVQLDARRVTVKELEIIGTNALIGAEDVPEAARLLSLDQTAWNDVAPIAIPLERLVADGIEPMLAGRATRIKTIVDPWAASTRPTKMS
ncbi:MAG TPA: alcohol dehydrogenase catalytic domain-containing protein [Candidatus Binatia bacterium]|nr:alcohol dehydrogenase catalytic domain-containing protein [Candidatus Binatia bacterium]